MVINDNIQKIHNCYQVHGHLPLIKRLSRVPANRGKVFLLALKGKFDGQGQRFKILPMSFEFLQPFRCCWLAPINAVQLDAVRRARHMKVL